MKRRDALLLASAAIAQGLTAPPARAATPLRVVEQPIDASLEVSYAQAHGFAAQAGLDVSIQMLPSNGAANLAAMLGGSVDIAISNIFSTLGAFERGIPLMIIAPSTLYTSAMPSTFLMVAKDSPLRTAADLNGKTIAASGLRNITQFAPMAWMDKNGGDSHTVRFVELPFANMAPALGARRVDAAVLAEPFASRATDARILAPVYDAIASQFLISAWVANTAWCDANASTARNFARMLYRTAAWANKNRNQTAETLVKVTKIEPSSVKSLVRATYAERYDPALVQPAIDVALRYGGITRPIRAEELISPGMPFNI